MSVFEGKTNKKGDQKGLLLTLDRAEGGAVSTENNQTARRRVQLRVSAERDAEDLDNVWSKLRHERRVR